MTEATTTQPHARTPKRINRQAVVIIHGIGEQGPMDTLRGFVSGIKATLESQDSLELHSKVRSKPDSIGDIYETVRLSMDSTNNRPITDFYEFYWAHNMRNSRFSYMSDWFKKLLFTWVNNIPKHLKRVWYTVWGFLILSAAAAFITTNFYYDWSKALIVALTSSAIITGLLTVLGAFFKNAFLATAGDAARYFTPKPDNIQERSNIRKQGIAFLKKLHSIETHEKPDRIIVVAHSLGSVIAYDLLRLLWTEYNDQISFSRNPQDALKAINEYSLGNKPLNTKEDVLVFQQAQYDCWKEQRDVKNGWLISDFITLGAAINAIDYFMVGSETTEVLIKQRELPICPALKDDHETKKDIFYRIHPKDQYMSPRRPRHPKMLVLNHAALFAVTRWTNIYFKPDYVGGPVGRVLGKGILDHDPIPRKSPWFLPGGHTKYWDKDDKANALEQIVGAMKLQHEEVTP